MARRRRKRPPRAAAASPMEPRRARPRWPLRCGLALVLAVAMGLSAWWAARVPIFGAPDEDVHFDYVVSLVTARRLLLASDRPVAEISGTNPFVPITHPYTSHLAQGSGTKQTRFRPEVQPPAGYGTTAFFAALDRSAPRLLQPPLRNPWVITEYPVGYYALAALWAAAWNRCFPGLVTLFFATRAFSVLLLGLGLMAWWAVLRRQACPPWRALGILTAVGLLPLTSFVSSYVQPDNLAFAAVPLCLWLALRAAAEPPSARRLAATGLALALLLLSKYHVFVSVALPVVALLAVAHTRWRQRRWLAWGLLLFGPVMLAAELQLWISSGGGSALRHFNTGSLRWQLLQEAGSKPVYLVRIVRSALHNFFAQDGVTFRTFWWLFGWLDTPVVIVSGAVHEVVVLLLQVGMVALLVLLVLRWQQAAAALAKHWLRGPRQRVLWLMVSRPLLISYLGFAVVMGAAYVYSGNFFQAQGRNWYAFLPAIFWAAVEYSPRALASRRAARWMSRAVLAGLLLYSLFGSYWGLRVVQERYYAPVTKTAEGFDAKEIASQ